MTETTKGGRKKCWNGRCFGVLGRNSGRIRWDRCSEAKSRGNEARAKKFQNDHHHQARWRNWKARRGGNRACPTSQAVAQLGAWVVGGMFKCFFAPGNFANDTRLEAVVPGRCCRPLFPRAGDMGGETGKLPKFPRPMFPGVGGTSVGNWKLAEVSEPSFCDFGEIGLETWACLQFWIF